MKALHFDINQWDDINLKQIKFVHIVKWILILKVDVWGTMHFI